jgi:hypothetical protein
MKRALPISFALAALSLSTTALAQTPAEDEPAPAAAPEPAPAPPPRRSFPALRRAPALPSFPAVERPAPRDEGPEGWATPEVSIAAGLRGMFIPGAGYEPYSSKGTLFQFALAAGLTVVRAGNASLMIFAEWDAGPSSARARGDDASIAIHRLGGGIEGKYQLARRFYLSAKLAPAAYYLSGSISDVGLPRPLIARSWTWGFDVSGGAGLLMGTAGRRAAPTRFWLTLDLGYAFAGSAAMNFAPGASEDDPRRFGTVMLPALKPAGAIGKLAMAISF